MNTSQLLSRLFKWTKIFGPALIVLELPGVAAAVITGNWNLTWVVPYIIVLIVGFTFIRLLLFVFLFFFPVLVAIIVVWAAFILFRVKRQEKANLEASTKGPTRSPDRAQ